MNASIQPGRTKRVPYLTRSLYVFVAMLAVSAPFARADGYDEVSLSVGDVVSFDFLDDTLPAETLTVASDGRVTLPLLGAVGVSGTTILQASAAIRKAFIERNFLIDPQFSLSVVTFRAIFVLGDVKSPGSFAFQPFLTVEQAVALAGGQLTGMVNGEDRVVTRARLQGDLDQAAVDLSKEAVAAARVVAQLDGRSEIKITDIPDKVKPLISDALLQTFIKTEQQILESDLRAFKTRSAQLSQSIDEVTGALGNLAQLVENQKLAIASARDDVARIKALTERGIKTRTELSGVERDATTQESHLLQILNQTSVTRRELSDLQRQLADATDTRKHAALVELQQHTAEIEATLASKRSKEEQILLISGIVAEAAQASGSLIFSYLIRRVESGSPLTITAGFGDIVRPGDTILVKIAHDAVLTAQSLGGLSADIAK